MSERTGGAPLGRVQRARRWTFLLLAMLLTVSLQTPAQAFTPAAFPPSGGPETLQPEATVTVSHEPASPTPKQGDPFTYKAVFDLTNMTEAGTANEVVLTVNAHSSAPWDAIPIASNFSSSLGTPTLSNCSTTSCTATYSNVKTNGPVIFTAAATVPTTLTNGVPLIGTAQAKINTNAGLSLKEEGTTAGPVIDCGADYTYVAKVEGAGGWLMDIKFANQSDGKIIPADDYSITFTGPGGADITADVLAKMTYNPNDPTPPYFPQSTTASNAIWLDSLNWKWDPSTYTGDTWLPAGTIITVKRHVSFAACAGGFALDGDVVRHGHDVAIEMSRPLTSTTAFGYDEFATPGKPEPTKCVDIYRSTASGGIYLWPTPAGNPTPSVFAPGGEISALAISRLHPERLYYYSTQSGFNYRDTSTNTTVPVSPPSGVTSSNFMGFGPDGTLWMIGYQTGNLYSLADGATAWVNRGYIGLDRYQGDLVLDSNGNMYIFWMSPAPRLSTITATELKKTSGIVRTTVNVTGVVGNDAGNWFGMAYGADGKLYVSATDNGAGTSYMYVLDPTTGALSSRVAVAGSTNGIKYTTDMASCSFGEVAPPQPAGPLFKWQKSVINPDGSVAAAGTTGQTHTVNPDGSITVRYLVTVSNVGVTAGIHPIITDNVRVPSGFTITDVLLDGVSKGTTGTFSIPGVSLDPTTGSGTSVTYLVTVKAKADLKSLTDNQWTEAGRCNTDGAGEPSWGGFFNTAVHQTADSDGANNNDACVPINPKHARLALIKKIVDGAGNEIGGSTDSKYFTLIAGPVDGMGTALSGSSASTGTIAVDQGVLPGTYALSEQGNDVGGTTSGTYTPGTWTCVSRATGAAVPVIDNKTITLNDGDNVACTITNTRNPVVHVVKNATDPTADNSHIGQTVIANPDGTFTAKYTITVKNTSDFIGDTGPINEYFAVPSGLLWDDTKVATVAFHPGTTGAYLEPAPGPTTATAAQLAGGLLLARSIQNMPAGSAVDFTIEIPLKLDTTPSTTDPTKTNFQVHETVLGTCSSKTSTGGNKYTETVSGIPNFVTLFDENLKYNDIPILDNIACIPVVAPKVHVVKTAFNPIDGNPHIGNTIRANDDGTFTANYVITVKNASGFMVDTGAIQDSFTVPAGLGWDQDCCCWL